jgi:hypothetical protein
MLAAITQLIPNWVAYLCCWVAIACMGIYFCVYSRGTNGYGHWRKFFLCACWLIAVVSISWGQITSRYRDANVIPPTVMYMTGWGSSGVAVTGNPPVVVSGSPRGIVNVDGRLLDKYKEQFELMAVSLHVLNGESYMDKSVGLCKSRLERIRPEDMTFAIDYNTDFLREIQLGAGSISFVLMAMPKGLKPEDFSTLNEAEDKGAQLIGQGMAQAPNMQQQIRLSPPGQPTPR